MQLFNHTVIAIPRYSVIQPHCNRYSKTFSYSTTLPSLFQDIQLFNHTVIAIPRNFQFFNHTVIAIPRHSVIQPHCNRYSKIFSYIQLFNHTVIAIPRHSVIQPHCNRYSRTFSYSTTL